MSTTDAMNTALALAIEDLNNYKFVTPHWTAEARLNRLLAAVDNLIRVKGRYHTELAFKKLEKVAAEVKT